MQLFIQDTNRLSGHEEAEREFYLMKNRKSFEMPGIEIGFQRLLRPAMACVRKKK